MAEEEKLEKVVEQNDGSAVIGELPTPPENENLDEEGDGEVSLSSADPEGGDHEGESEESKTERNRQRRHEAKQRRQEYIEGLKRELASRDRIINELNQRVSVVERRSSGSEMAQLDHYEREATNYYNHFKQVNAKAIEAADGAAANDAQEKMFAARQRLSQIANIRKAVSNQAQQPAPLDPRVISGAQDWASKNSWYDPNGDDEDSYVVRQLDNRLAQTGWNPSTPEYWEELTSRVNKFLPHRAKKGYNQGTSAGTRSERQVPVAGSGREASPGKGGTFTLSADRVKALKDADLWDDPKKRAEAIKRFQQFDKEQAA